MKSLKNHIKLYIVSILFAALGSSIAYSQELPMKGNFDTSNLTIRVCNGDLPGQEKEPHIDYTYFVCAYRSKNKKLIQYKVVGFDLVFKGPEGKIETASTTGNQLSLMMKSMLIRADSEDKMRNLFLDNVKLLNNDKRTVIVIGLRTLFTIQ